MRVRRATSKKHGQSTAACDRRKGELGFDRKKKSCSTSCSHEGGREKYRLTAGRKNSKARPHSFRGGERKVVFVQGGLGEISACAGKGEKKKKEKDGTHAIPLPSPFLGVGGFFGGEKNTHRM